jgi:hypothetical protein
MIPQKYPSLRELLKRTTGAPYPQRTATEIIKRLDSAHPDYTGVGVFKAGPIAPALILPVGPSCQLKTMGEAVGTVAQGDRTLVGYWIK